MDKILYVVDSDPNDKRSWSGTIYGCMQQLRRFYDVETLCIKPDKLDIILFWLLRSWGILTLRHLNYWVSFLYAKRASKRLNNLLKDKSEKEYKAIFLIGMHLGAYIRTNIPIIYFSDATFHLMMDYYKGFNRSQSQSGNTLQKLVLDNAKWAIFASDWAMNDAIHYYSMDSKKCFVGKLGANVDTSNFVHTPDEEKRNLLFVGVEWDRKGGDVVVKCMEELNRLDSSHKYVLHLVGVRPPYPITNENIKVYGFLNRNIPEEQKQMISLREKADLFILPTKAECAGIVFCESSAYGIPSLTYDTGGIGSYVVDGENGYRLPIESTAKDFASKIIQIFNDESKLQYMRKRAVEMYREDMNWDSWGNRIKSIIG